MGKRLLLTSPLQEDIAWLTIAYLYAGEYRQAYQICYTFPPDSQRLISMLDTMAHHGISATVHSDTERFRQYLAGDGELGIAGTFATESALAAAGVPTNAGSILAPSTLESHFQDAIRIGKILIHEKYSQKDIAWLIAAYLYAGEYAHAYKTYHQYLPDTELLLAILNMIASKHVPAAIPSDIERFRQYLQS